TERVGYRYGIGGSAIPGERDLVENARAEALRGTCHRFATERAIKAYRRFVVRERPDNQALQAALHEIAACSAKQLAPETEPLEFRPQVELVQLAIVVEAAGPVAAVIGVAGDAIAECQDCDAAAFADRVVPPLRAAPVDELVEFGSGDHALVGVPPSLVVRRRDAVGISGLGATDLDQDRAHDVNRSKRAVTLPEQW